VTADGHWGDGYYGALYLDSAADLLSPALSALEAEAVALLLRLGPRDAALDLGCGHGRHARRLAGRVRRLVGLDRSGDYLRRAAAADPGAALVRGDVRALPFRPGAFDAVYSWYASLFMFDDRTNLACLAEAARVLRPGGRLLVHHANPLRLARDPVERAARTLADGSRVEEVSEYDAARGLDRCARRLVRPDGAVLAGTAELRYYMPSEWGPLAERAGLRLVELTTTPEAGRAARRDPGPDAPDLIALLEKPT
jgi:SAM-dependent methyltransferase